MPALRTLFPDRPPAPIDRMGVLLRRAREPYRRVLIVGGLITFVALPMVLGLGRRADNPWQLPLPYGANLAGVLVALAVRVAAWGAPSRRMFAAPRIAGEPHGHCARNRR